MGDGFLSLLMKGLLLLTGVFECGVLEGFGALVLLCRLFLVKGQLEVRGLVMASFALEFSMVHSLSCMDYSLPSVRVYRLSCNSYRPC